MEKQILNTPMQWNINISILKNPLLWFQLLMVAFLASSYLMFLMVGINLFERHWEDIPASLSVGLVVGGGLFIAFSLILILIFWRGIPTKYVIQDGHIEQHTLHKVSKILNRLGPFAILTGTNAGITAAGASLLARSREIIAVDWKEVTDIKAFSARREIQLHNDWRTNMQVVCPEGQFENILEFIQLKTKKNRKPEKLKENTETSFAKKVILSIFSLIFGVFLFPRLPIHYVGILSIATMIFAFLALWSSGVKQRIFGGVLILLPIIGVSLAFVAGEVEMYHQGAIYALIIELILLGFFLLLGLGVVFKYIK